MTPRLSPAIGDGSIATPRIGTRPADVFVHISAVERAGLQNLNEGQKITYRLRLRGSSGAKDEFLLAATAQNLRKLAKIIPLPAPVFVT